MQRILWVSFLICLACYMVGPIVDPDLWWHITAGRWILAHGAVPQVDYWNMFGAGKPWRAYSWSNEIVYALADRYYGPAGLLTIKYLLAGVVVFSFGAVFGKLSKDWFLGAMLAAFGAGACVSHFTLRPQSLVWAIFAWVLYEAHRCNTEGLTRRRGIVIFLLFAAWANTHVTTIIGLGGLFAFAHSKAKLKDALIVTGVGFAGTLATPYFGGEWIAFLSQASHPFDMRSISEFKPATILQFPTSFLVLGTALYGMLLFLGRRVIEPFRLLGLGVAALAGLAVIKFMPLASIYVTALIAVEWEAAAITGAKIELIKSFEILRDGFTSKIPPEGMSFLLLCLSAVFAWNMFRGPISNRVVPVAAVDFIDRHKLEHPILNDFGRGGYLMYRYATRDGEPIYQVPIDGRTNVMPKEVWQKHEAALFGRERWREYLDLVKPKTILWPTESPLLSILEATKEWCRVFRSGDAKEGFSVLIPAAAFEERKSELKAESCWPNEEKAQKPAPQRPVLED